MLTDLTKQLCDHKINICDRLLGHKIRTEDIKNFFAQLLLQQKTAYSDIFLCSHENPLLIGF